MDSDAAQTAQGSADAGTERIYPQVDCAGVYLWIWERISRTEAGTTITARRIHRDQPP